MYSLLLFVNESTGRMNVYKDVLTEDKVVGGGWLNFKEDVVEVTNNYENSGALDDVKTALGKLTDWTKEYIVPEQTVIADSAAAIGRNLDEQK